MNTPTKKRFKITKFDKDLLHYVSDGPASKKELLAKTRVAESEFDKRVKKLKAQKYLVLEGEQIALGISGYNQVKKMEAAKKRRQQKKELTQLKPKSTLPKTTIVKKEPIKRSGPASNNVKSPESALDLYSVFNTEKNRLDAIEKKIVIPNSLPPRQQIPSFKKEPWPPKRAEEQKEKCELCKGVFSLSVKGGNPKFGHCFCGAAYHKDCYEAIMNGDKHCARCGRKLELYLNKESEEAVKSIRDVFD